MSSKAGRVSGTKEWATHNVNIIHGCEHRCLYCYAASMAARFGRKPAGTWAEEELNPKAFQRAYRKREGGTDSEVLKFWEPGAPSFGERLACLRHAHAGGYRTSTVAEPLLDRDPAPLVEALAPWVTDSMWIGTINRGRSILKLNGHATPEVMDRFAELPQKKEDVQEFYHKLKDRPGIKWKDSIKEMMGLERPVEIGLDI